MSTNKLKGLRQNSRSPGSITNAEHHDVTGSSKNIYGHPLAIEKVLADSTDHINNAVRNHATIRIYNASGAVAYIWAGKEDAVPGTVDVTTGVAIAQDSAEVFYVGYSDDIAKSIVVKTSSSLVQVVVIEG